MPGERPVGTPLELAGKKVAPYPTERWLASGPGRERGVRRDSSEASPDLPEVVERSGQVFDPIALLKGASQEVTEVCRASPGWVSETIRRIAWGGDRRRGTAQVELGAGVYAGACVRVDANGASLHIEVSAPPGVDASELAERLHVRFEGRGLLVDSVRVR